MVFLIFAWLLLGASSWTVGTGVLGSLTSFTSLPRCGDRAYLAVWLGLIILANSLLVTSLVVPLSPLVSIAVVLALATASLQRATNRAELHWQWHTLGRHRGWIVIVTILALAVAAYGAQPVTLYDTGFYHFQALQWLSQVGTVPGLALLFAPLGYPSSWLALSAPWNTGILETRIASITGSFAFFLLCSQVLLGGWRLLQRCGQLADWFLVWSGAIVLSVLARSSLPISPSPDMGVVCLSLLTAWLLLLAANQPETSRAMTWRTSELLAVLLAAGALSMKLTALPLWAIAMLIYSRGNWQRWVSGSLASGVILLPSLLFGILTSSCPLYPLPVCIPGLPWSISAETMEALVSTIRACARWSCPPEPPAAAAAWAWLWPWLQQQRQATFLLSCTGLGLIYYAYRPASRPRGWRVTSALGGCGSLFVMSGSPLLRIGVGYFVLIPALIAARACMQQSPWRWLALALVAIGANLWLHPSPTLLLVIMAPVFATLAIVSLPRRWQTLGILIGTLLLASSTVVRTALMTNEWQFHVLLPPPLQPARAVAYTTRRISNFVHYLPDPDNPINRRPEIEGWEDRCWAQPLPCTPYITLSSVHEDLRLRASERGLRGGFERQPS